MKCLRLSLLAMLISASIASAQDAPATQPSYAERYGVLSERNIFVRDRRKPAPAPPSTAPVRTPEQSLMLTGIVIEDGEFRAYFEDFRSASIVRVATGEPIARGRVTEIQFDAVAYESGNGVEWIEIGQDLTGAIVAAPAPIAASTTAPASGTSAASTDGATTAPDGAVDPSTLSVEERMRLRRLQGK